MDIQQLAIKVFAAPGSLDQGKLTPVFHKWIRERRLGDVLLIDVADYRHVPEGPGMMLIGHEAHWAFDQIGGRAGLRYARKRDAVGDAVARLREAFAAVFLASEALEKEPSLAGEVAFVPTELELRIMSRLVAPNTAETYAAFAPVLEGFLRELYGTGEIALEHLAAPRESFGVRIQMQGQHTLAGLRERLAAA